MIVCFISRNIKDHLVQLRRSSSCWCYVCRHKTTVCISSLLRFLFSFSHSYSICPIFLHVHLVLAFIVFVLLELWLLLRSIFFFFFFFNFGLFSFVHLSKNSFHSLCMLHIRCPFPFENHRTTGDGIYCSRRCIPRLFHLPLQDSLDILLIL